MKFDTIYVPRWKCDGQFIPKPRKGQAIGFLFERPHSIDPAKTLNLSWEGVNYIQISNFSTKKQKRY